MVTVQGQPIVAGFSRDMQERGFTMLAYRTTWMVKQGRMQEALDLISAETQRAKSEGAVVRIYTPSIGPNVLVFEMVSETAEAHDAFWTEYNKDPKAAAFWEKWGEVTERSLGSDRWKLAEWR
jgi:hypothetical protein